MFSLVVDDFGVKYVGKEYVDHLISKDWDGQLYCGIHMKWDYNKRTIDLSMSGYITATLHKYQYLTN